jgi:Mn2+/Fe2+ NRAMP family transporter
MAGTFQWKNSLERAPMMAKQFYGIIALSTFVGIALGFTTIDPIKALYWSAVINGVISVPIMVVMMLMAARKDIMGQFVITAKLKVLGWLATLMMALAVLAMSLTM